MKFRRLLAALLTLSMLLSFIPSYSFAADVEDDASMVETDPADENAQEEVGTNSDTEAASSTPEAEAQVEVEPQFEGDAETESEVSTQSQSQDESTEPTEAEVEVEVEYEIVKEEAMMEGETSVASIGEKNYNSITEALTNAQKGDTVNVFEGNFELKSTDVIPEGVTLKGAGKDKTTLVISTETGSGITVGNKDVTICDLTLDGHNITSGGYKCLINVTADGVLIKDAVLTGGGQSTWNSSILVEQLTNKDSFTLENSTVSGSFRAVLRESCNGNIIIKNSELTAVYPINIDGGADTADKQGVVVVTDSKLHGWTSYSSVRYVSFTNCEFTKASYDVVAAYNDTYFNQCSFDSSFQIYAQKNPFIFTLNGCTKNGELVTPENIIDKFDDSDVWMKCVVAFDTDDATAEGFSGYTKGSFLTGNAKMPTCKEGFIAVENGSSGEATIYSVGKIKPTVDTVNEAANTQTFAISAVNGESETTKIKDLQTITVSGETDTTSVELSKMDDEELNETVETLLSKVSKVSDATDVENISIGVQVKDADGNPITDANPIEVVTDANGVKTATVQADAIAVAYDAYGVELESTAVSNVALNGANFSFRLPVPAGLAAEGELIDVIHKSKGYDDETIPCRVQKDNGKLYVTVTVTHFSQFVEQSTNNPNAVAYVEGTTYETLADAIAAANGKTVYLLKNIDNEVVEIVSNNVTIDLNGYELQAIDGIYVDGVSLTLAATQGGTLKSTNETAVTLSTDARILWSGQCCHCTKQHRRLSGQCNSARSLCQLSCKNDLSP